MGPMRRALKEDKDDHAVKKAPDKGGLEETGNLIVTLSCVGFDASTCVTSLMLDECNAVAFQRGHAGCHHSIQGI